MLLFSKGKALEVLEEYSKAWDTVKGCAASIVGLKKGREEPEREGEETQWTGEGTQRKGEEP